MCCLFVVLAGWLATCLLFVLCIDAVAAADVAVTVVADVVMLVNQRNNTHNARTKPNNQKASTLALAIKQQ